MEQSEKTLDMIVNLCKNRGYVFPGSEIYGGLANSWDYGPLGVEFKNNVKKAWLKKFVQESPYNVGLDAAIIMNPQTWVTTGHVSSFSDPLLDCRACKARHRADKLIGEEHPEVNVDAMSFDEMDAFIAEHEDIVCPVCGKHDFTPIRFAGVPSQRGPFYGLLPYCFSFGYGGRVSASLGSAFLAGCRPSSLMPATTSRMPTRILGMPWMISYA